MKIKGMTFEHRNDFAAAFVCEHCGHEQNLSGYHDNHFHTKVIPELFCPKCGLDRMGKMDPNRAKEPESP